MPPTLRNRKPKVESPLNEAINKKVSKTKAPNARTTPDEEPVAKPVKSRKRNKTELVENYEVKDEKDRDNKFNKSKKSKTKQDIISNGTSLAIKMDKSGYTHWLMKAEPESRVVKGKDVKFSIDDLKAMENSTSQWDGVRNFEARNIMRDRMKIGHKVLFYHSNCKTPGVAGIAKVVREGYEDYTAFDEKHPYYDPKSDKSNPKWFMVDLKFVRKLNRLIPLKELQSYPELSEMALVKRGRLSVQPVTEEEYNFILSQEDKDVDSK
ncbi:hypothetical protein VKS41_000120 [Umbelopsis sp. WA50703]